MTELQMRRIYNAEVQTRSRVTATEINEYRNKHFKPDGTRYTYQQVSRHLTAIKLSNK